MWTTNGLINYAYDGLYDDGTDSDLTLTMTSIVELNASQQVRFRLRQPLLKLLYICVSFWLLVHESRDLSQAETKNTLVKGFSFLYQCFAQLRF